MKIWEVTSESTWYLDCKLVVLPTCKFTHASPFTSCPKLAVHSPAVFDKELPGLSLGCPFFVLPLEFNILWEEAWYKTEAWNSVWAKPYSFLELTYSPSFTVQRSSEQSVLSCTNLQCSCPMVEARMLSLGTCPEVILTTQSYLVCSSSPGHKRICGISSSLTRLHLPLWGGESLSFSRLVNS